MKHATANLRIVFIGGGNMGRALAVGLLDGGWTAKNVTLVDTDPDTVATLKKRFEGRNVNVFSRAEAALTHADIVVLAIKPQAMRAACEQIAVQCQSTRPLIISIAAGITIKDVDAWLGGSLAIVRCMPNTPVLVQAGATAMYANSEVLPFQRDIAEDVLGSVGLALWMQKESMLDAVTAVSGSGPAYFFYLIEAMLEAGQSLGLDEKQARSLILHTAIGAVELLKETNEAPQKLRHAVTSKGGTTEAAVKTLEQGDVKSIIYAAVIKAAEKAKRLGSPATTADPARDGQT